MREDWRSRIAVDPKVLAGKLVLKGTRIAVEFILELLANGWTIEDILKNYPQLKRGRTCRSEVCDRSFERREGLPAALTKLLADETRFRLKSQ